MTLKMLITVALLSTSAIWAGDKRLFDLNFDMESGSKLLVKLEGATVDIEGHNGNKLNFFAKVEGRSKFVESYDFDFDESNGNLKIVGKAKEKGWHWHKEGKVVVRLKVPHKVYVWLRTSGADVRARSMEKPMELRTSGGDVMVRDVNGIVVRSSGGGVQLVNNIGTSSLSTSGGNVYVENQVGDTLVRTSGGSVRMVAVKGEVSAKTSGGDIRIELHGSNHGINAHTSGGNVYLYVKDKLNAELSARTSGGTVSVDFPMRVHQKRDDSLLDATINKGGPEVILRSSGGDIKVRKL